MKKLLLTLLLAATMPAFAWTQRQPYAPQACAVDAPWGFPQLHRQADTTPICRQGYFVLHDNQAKIPVYVAWHLLPQHVNGCVPRSNAFAADQSLPPGKRSEPHDYAGSGYDQGHLANDSHQSWDPQVELESFLMSNMSPQWPSINRGSWKLLETTTGAWSFELNKPLIIYAGNIYGAQDKTIGANHVVVPHNLWKVVIDQTTGQYAAWIFPNTGNPGNDLTKLRIPLAQLQQLTGLTLPVPPNGRELAPAEMWPVDYGALTKAKRQACGSVASND